MNSSNFSLDISDISGKKILVIDDDLTQLTFLSSILKKFGFQVSQFQDPMDALRKISEGYTPDVILTDIFMPKINGWELCRILKSELFPQTREIPILILSSQIVGEEIIKTAKEAGAYDFVELPTLPESILERITSALKGEETKEIKLKILVVSPQEGTEDLWDRNTEHPRYILFVVHSTDEAVEILLKEDFDIVLLSSKIDGDTNKLFSLLNDPLRKEKIFTFIVVPPQSPQPFLNWVERGVSGVLTKPINIESVLNLYEKIKIEKMLLKTKKLAEEKIKQKLEEEIRWATILRSIPIGIFIKDTNLRYTQVNKSYASFFKKDPIDFILHPDEEFFDPPYSDEFRNLCRKVLKNEIYRNFQWEVSIEKTNYIFTIYIEPLKNLDGEITGIYGFLMDITQEASLQRNYKNLFEMMDEAFAEHEIVYDEVGKPIDYKFITVNPGFEKMTGLKKEEVIGKRVKEILPDLEPFWITTYSEVVSTGKSVTFENYTKTLDKYYLVHAYKTGKNSFGCIFTDITQKKKFEEEIKRLNREWQLTFDNVNSVIWFLDNEFKISKTNNAVIKILNLTPDEILNRKCWEVVHGTKQPPDFCPVIRLLRSKKRETLEFQKDDKWYEVVVDPVFDEQHILTGFVHILSDITDKKKAEKEKEEVQKQLFLSQKLESIGRLAGDIAHDFKNMLTAILGNIELAILKYESGEDIKEHLVELRKATDKATEITNKILAFVRKQNSKPKLLNINAELSQSLKILKKILPETISLEFQPAENLWNIFIDPVHLDTIILNLCVNAKEAITGYGRILIKTENTVVDSSLASKNPEAKPGEHIKITISDTGHGIPPDILPYIFDPFFTTKRESGGSGLGLSIVYGVVKQNNGFMTVHSEVNKGTTFEIYLPKAGISSGETSSQKESLTESEDTPVHPINLTEERNKVLIVDDEPSITEVLKNISIRLGLDPIVASKPSQALKLLEDNKNSIILAIIDIMLPEMSGTILMEKIREISPTIKTILITGYSEEFLPELKPDNIDVIHKPFSVVTLSKKITQLLGK